VALLLLQLYETILTHMQIIFIQVAFPKKMLLKEIANAELENETKPKAQKRSVKNQRCDIKYL